MVERRAGSTITGVNVEVWGVPAEPSRAGDGSQRPLRSRCPPRLTRSVRPQNHGIPMSTEKIWKPLDKPELGMLNTISETIRMEEWRNPDLLTSVRSGPSLVIASDYGGEHQSASYRSFSFIIADLQYLWYWDDIRQKLRKTILKDSRRLSFKTITEPYRAQALVPFLRATNTIPGLLATFLIDKRVQSLFCEDSGDNLLDRPIVDRTRWNQKSFEKLCRIAHFGSMLVAGLSAPRQNVLWVTDEDEIVPNFDKHKDATNVFAHCMSHYVTHQMGHFRLATTRSDDGSLSLEDLATIPDLAAGSLAEIASRTASEGGFPCANLVSALSDKVSKKAHAVFAWLADGPHPLRKITFCIEHVPPDHFMAYLLRAYLRQPIPEYNWVPEFIMTTGGVGAPYEIGRWSSRRGGASRTDPA